jgi:hypothetical protein
MARRHGAPDHQAMSPFQDRRRGDRRRDDRRTEPRREVDRAHERRRQTVAGAWALCGALVVLYLFLVAIGGVDPSTAPGASLAALVLAAAWLGHSWRRIWTGGASPVPDRERRGF